MGEKKDVKKVTLDSLAARAQKTRQERTEYKDYYSELLGGTIPVKRLPVKKVAEILDNTEDSSETNIEANIELVYNSVPMFQDRSLQEKAECVEPTDIVLMVLNDNMNELNNIAEFILNMFGIQIDEAIDNLKN